jgi:hypothetical protein
VMDRMGEGRQPTKQVQKGRDNMGHLGKAEEN